MDLTPIEDSARRRRRSGARRAADAPRAKPQRVTLAQIADLAGVSTATVSKVLNGRLDVAPDTRGHVQRLLTEAGYTPRGARPGAPIHLVELLMTELGSPWAGEVLRGAEDEAQRHGAGLVVTATHSRSPGSLGWVEAMARRKSAGAVLVASGLSDAAVEALSSQGIAFVLVDPVGGVSSAVPIVGAANWAGGLAATEHLIALGHWRIGVITGPAELVCSQERLDGYRAALARAALPVDPRLERHGNFSPEGGRREADALLTEQDPPTAIFAGSDLQAMGVYAEAAHRKLDVPGDLSVVGFDDLPLCQWLEPQLTTVRQPLAEMARLATRMVLDHRPQPDGDQVPRIELATSLVTRSSTSAPRPGRSERRPG